MNTALDVICTLKVNSNFHMLATHSFKHHVAETNTFFRLAHFNNRDDY